jgi:hypothetical protein
MKTQTLKEKEDVIFLPAKEWSEPAIKEKAPSKKTKSVARCARCKANASTQFQHCQNCGAQLFPF